MRQVPLLPFLQVRKLRFRGVQGLVGVPQLVAEEPIAGPGRWSSESSPVPRDAAPGTKSYHLSRFEAEEQEPLSGMTVNSSPFQFMSDPILHQEKLLKRCPITAPSVPPITWQINQFGDPPGSFWPSLQGPAFITTEPASAVRHRNVIMRQESTA